MWLLKPIQWTYEFLSSKSPLAGKYLSIIGDSISTFQGWSNVAPGSTSAAIYYPQTFLQNVEQTYWHKLITRTGMNLLVNNSWSGSECAGPSTSGSAVVSQSNDRCHQLHKTIDGKVVNPDYILINIGTNDFDHDFELGTWNGRGEKFPANPAKQSPTTFREAYAVMLHRLRIYYPLAKIFCCTLPCGNNEGGDMDEINGTGYYLSEWNDAIREIATAYGVKVIELATAGMDYYTLGTLYGDNRLHPSEAGMERYYEIIRPAMENEATTTTSTPRKQYLMKGSAPTLELSNAEDVSTLVAQYNALLQALKTRGVILTIGSGTVTPPVESQIPETITVNNQTSEVIQEISQLRLTSSSGISDGNTATWGLQTSVESGAGRFSTTDCVLYVPENVSKIKYTPNTDMLTLYPEMAWSVFELDENGGKSSGGLLASQWLIGDHTFAAKTRYTRVLFRLYAAKKSVEITDEQKAKLLSSLEFEYK